ncbi:MAG: alanine racemase [Ruminococcaceae bacterium]|nr:alanine racemase [Oscillospiraceae bacterium]
MRTWSEVNLDAINENINSIRSILNKDTKVLAVVKADAYGHGAAKVALSLVKNKIDYLGVATSGEAMELRNIGIKTPILILGAIYNENIGELISNDITLTVFDYKTALNISNVAKKLNKIAKIHIKIDTGMTRIGFYPTDDSVKEICKISKLDSIEIEGMFSHFAKADEEDENPTHIQFEKFMNIKNKLEEMKVQIPICHICNSAGIIDFPEYQLNMVRSGIITYGHYPSECVNHKKIKLTPAMTFKTLVANINQIEKGTSVGYGGTFTAEKSMKIATLLVGYADGYSRLLSNKADVLINGERCSVVGRVCMDQTMVDVSKLKNINLGDEVILFGKSGNNIVTVEEVAKIIGTINYEILCAVSKRVPRIYIQGA